jgi:hypothetical protein
VYGFILILATIFVIIFVPETKQKPVEEIIKHFETSMIVYPKPKKQQN